MCILTHISPHIDHISTIEALFNSILLSLKKNKEKKMKPFSPFKNIGGKRRSWQWPSCNRPKTLSFRASDEVIKTVNSVCFNPSDEVVIPDTWFTTSLEAPSQSTRSEGLFDREESCEVIIRELVLSERMFFEPEESKSILKHEKANLFAFEDNMAMLMESKDPCGDFRRSMEEIVETYGLRRWECLDELLGWYLRVNNKKNHGFIVGAFVDLLVGMVSTNICSDFGSGSDSDSFASCFSSHSYPLCPLQEKESTIEDDNIVI